MGEQGRPTMLTSFMKAGLPKGVAAAPPLEDRGAARRCQLTSTYVRSCDTKGMTPNSFFFLGTPAAGSAAGAALEWMGRESMRNHLISLISLRVSVRKGWLRGTPGMTYK